MKCYQHDSHDAVAVCKTCGKALCPDCTFDQRFAITCKGKCAEQAKVQQRIFDKSEATMIRSIRSLFLLPFLFFIGAATIICFDLYFRGYVTRGTIIGAAPLLLLGFVFLLSLFVKKDKHKQ